MSLYEFYNNEAILRRIFVARAQDKARREARIDIENQRELEAFR